MQGNNVDFLKFDNNDMVWRKLKTIVDRRDMGIKEADGFIYDEHLTLFVDVEMAFEFLDVIRNPDEYNIDEEYLSDLSFWVDYIKRNNIVVDENEIEEKNKKFQAGDLRLKMPEDLDLVPYVMPKLKSFKEYKHPLEYGHYKWIDEYNDYYVPYFHAIRWGEQAEAFVKDKLNKTDK